MERNTWEQLKKIIGFGTQKYWPELMGGGLLGIFNNWNWFGGSLDFWLVAKFHALILLLKGLFSVSLSAVTSAYVSYLFKKHILKIDQHEPPTRKRQGKRKKAA